MMAGNHQDYGKVALIIGGEGSERQVSLDGGRAVEAALRRQNIELAVCDGLPELRNTIAAGQVDRVFNLLHGRGGEDGVLQGFLEAQGIAYTGAGVLGCAITMDKVRTKSLWHAGGLPTPRFVQVTTNASRSVLEKLELPLVLKPVREGSSVGMTIVRKASELAAGLDKALAYDDMVLAETYIDGPEYTAAILNGQCLPLIRIEPAAEFYDYHAKYEADTTRYHCPAGLDEAREQELSALCLRAFALVACIGWGRVDFMLDRAGQPQLLEVNTTPGMTDHSLVPKAAAAADIDFDQLVLRILDTSFVRRANAAGASRC